MSSGRPELAESPLNEALGLNPESSMAWHQRGLLYLDWSRDEAAISDFKKAVATDPTNIEAQLHIAAIYHEAQNWNEAEEAWRNILSTDPEHTVARRRFDECTAKIATSEILNNC
jgi:Tfp pilus assembly protein PilF